MARSGRVAVLTVYAWLEEEAAPALRARVTWVLDVERPEEVTAAAAGRDAILALMRLWLDQLADGEPASSAEYS